MSWSPADLVSDVDLRDYEESILKNFGPTTWQARRTKALEDWLFPILKEAGFDPYRLRTRAEPTLAYGYTSSVYSDLTSATKDTTADDVNLATVFATPSTDVLYLGSTRPFRGIFLRLLDTVSSAAGVLSVKYFNGNWEPLQVADATAQVAGKTLSSGGAVTWVLPVDWMTRAVNGSAALYWAKVTVSAVPTGAKAGQIGVIRSSALRAPVTFRTLQLIFREAPTGADGPWRDKAEFYKGEADAALQRALGTVAGEFDTDESDLISETEAAQTPEDAGGSAGGWLLERY